MGASPMATLLKNVVRFVGLLPGVPTALAHGLQLDNGVVVPVLPDFAAAKTLAAGTQISAVFTTTLVTLTNTTAETVDVDVFVEYWHTFERALPTDPLPGGPFLLNLVQGAVVDVLDVPGQHLDVYVDGLNGRDTNSGTSPTAALQTLPAVRRRFPKYMTNNASLTVHLAGVGGFGASATSRLEYVAADLWVGGGGEAPQQSYNFRGPQMVTAKTLTGAPLDGQMMGIALAAIPAITCRNDTTPDALGCRNRIVPAVSPGWTPNQLRGKFARLMRGANMVSFEAPITENDANVFYLDSQYLFVSIPLLATDTLDIVEPAVNLRGPSTVANIYLEEMYIHGEGAGSADGATFWPPPVIWRGATFERIAFQGSGVGIGGIPTFRVPGLTLDRCQFDIGFTIKYGSTCAYANCVVQGRGLGYASHHGGGTQGFYTEMRPDSLTSPVDPDAGKYDLVVCNEAFSVSGQLVIEMGVSAYGSPVPYGAVDVEGPGAFLYIQHSCLLGKENAGYGLSVSMGAEASVSGQAGVPANTRGRTEIAGSAANKALVITQDDGVAIVSCGYGDGVGEFGELAGYNGNFTRLGDSSRISYGGQ